ncbi:hypothetical protein P692DRAFT_201774918 [Suillus brevipes Sb2]|nr:hypothetical protein P692DRAFT_201774918 [Suillus brevipes Sb2]
MAANTGTVPKTPTHGTKTDPQLKSTPQSAGTAAMSEHLSAVGLGIEDLRPWIARDIEDYKEADIDKMLAELLLRCTDTSKPTDKSTLLENSLKAVLRICNDGTIQGHMGTLLDSPNEQGMYKPFIEAANYALCELSTLNVPGLVPSKAGDDHEIIFHQNDPSHIYQTHQGEQSLRKPDIVIVSKASAMKVWNCKPGEVYKKALEKPKKKFEWKELRTTLEFKKTKATLNPVPQKYQAKTTYKISGAKKFMKFRREMDTSAEEPEPDATPVPPNAGRSSLSEPPLKGPKRPSQADDERNTKKFKTESGRLHPVVQNGMYAAEIFAAHFARQSVISYVVENDIIYTWYFDRQGAIQCSGINFVQDFPRFMVLLLVMQRMPYAKWGHHTLPELVSSAEIRVHDKKLGEVDLKFDLASNKRTTHFGLRGRATTVFPVESAALSALVPQLPHHNPHNPTDKLVAKLYWPEEERESEADILQKVYKIANEDVEHHVPEMVWSHKFEDTSTANIREALEIDDAEKGRRVFYIIVFRELLPITKLSGDEFLKAWWQIVVCHYALWENGVHHRDISPSNLMVYKTSGGQWIGVLNDFDLSSTRDTPSGQERTGTVPFMALDLLTEEGTKGQVKHLYQHDAESFIWVLTWICICYEDGVYIGKRTKLHDWLRVDALGCHKKKSSFLNNDRKKISPSLSHGGSWKVALSCLVAVAQHQVPQEALILEDQVVFDTWLRKSMIL